MKLASSKQFAPRMAANKDCHHCSFSSKSQEVALGGPAGVSTSLVSEVALEGARAAGTGGEELLEGCATIFSETLHAAKRKKESSRSQDKLAHALSEISGHRNINTWCGRGAERPEAELFRPQPQWERQRYSLQ